MNTTSATTRARTAHQRPAHAIVATGTATRPDTRTSASAAPGLIPDTHATSARTDATAPLPRLSRVGATAATSASRTDANTSPEPETPVSPNATSARHPSRAPMPPMATQAPVTRCERIAHASKATQAPMTRDARRHAHAQREGVRQICGADSVMAAQCPRRISRPFSTSPMFCLHGVIE